VETKNFLYIDALELLYTLNSVKPELDGQHDEVIFKKQEK
jgi:hypothetical protein